MAESPPKLGGSEPVRDEKRRQWPPRRVLLVAALWAVGAAALGVLSFFAHQESEFPGDVGLTVWVQRLHQPVLVHLVNIASDANWPTPGGIIALSVICGLAVFRWLRAALSAAFGAFGADGINVELNKLVARPRPHNAQIQSVAHLGLHSFPSGHVTHVVAFYGFLLYLSLVLRGAHPRLRHWLLLPQAICIYFLVCVGPSRVLEGEHWPSDVLGGYLLGALLLVLAVALFHALPLLHQRALAFWRARHRRG